MSEMQGVVNGVYYCQQGRTQELSNRMFERNIPSATLAPQYSIRPVSTKYALMPIVDQRKEATVPIQRSAPYNIKTTFNPGNAQAPWSGFATQINDESRLRNQFFALQECEQANYVPSSRSDMYQVAVTSRPVKQQYPLLFEKPEFAPQNMNIHNLGKNLFYNHTREQLKNASCL